MIRVGIIGATGYTSLELIKLLLRHPDVSIARLTSRNADSPLAGEVHASLSERLDLRLSAFSVDDFADNVDFAFSCLPHAASAAIVAQLLQKNIRAIDFSADYRLSSTQLFENVYSTAHPDPERVGHVPYGIPELFRDSIRDATVVANPGCFPSSVLLPIAPLLSKQLIQPDPIIADSKTGISGAGRKASLTFHYPECNESVAAYGVGTHRHMPEIDDVIERFSGAKTNIVFTPHVVPMDRGILSTIYALPPEGIPVAEAVEAVKQCLSGYYASEPFIRMSDKPPLTKSVSGSNYCDIHVTSCGRQIVILSALDNLIKGASGAAVQNFNAMHGFDETTALG